jgi:hypothetical protein
VNSVNVFREIFSCFSSSSNNILLCSYAVLQCRLHQHGLSMHSHSWSVVDAHRLLTYHLMYGLCCTSRGESCTSLANGAQQHDVASSVLENVIALCHCRVVGRGHVMRDLRVKVHLMLPHIKPYRSVLT